MDRIRKTVDEHVLVMKPWTGKKFFKRKIPAFPYYFIHAYKFYGRQCTTEAC
jgi:hypothetical protein